MKKSKKRKIRHNSKTTEIKCFRCKSFKISQRKTAKFCSTLCRVQERNDRIENGYTHFIVDGTLQQVADFFDEYDKLEFGFGFFYEYGEIKDYISSADVNLSWKVTLNGFLVYYFANNKKKPFEIYSNDANQTKFERFEIIIKQNRTVAFGLRKSKIV